MFALLLGLAAAGLWPHAPSPAARDTFPASFLARSAEFHRVTYPLYAVRQAIALAALAWLAFSGAGARWGDRALRAARGRAWLGAVIIALGVTVLLALLDLPFAWFRGFFWEHRFGLSTQTEAGWWADHAKGLAIGGAIEALALGALAALSGRFPRTWWAPAAVLCAFGIWLLTVAGPVVLDPLFFRFTPLPPSPLRAELLAMASRAGVPARDVLVADASRRTTAVNAYVAGSGPTRRLVLYDTLLAQYDRDQVELVVAHEIGHVQKRHIEKGLTIGMAAAALGVAGLFLLMRGLARTGVAPPLPHPGALPWALLVAAIASFLAMPVQNGLSRAFERQADAVSFRLAPHPQAAVALERNLGITNLADVDPEPYIEWLLFDHPSQVERVEAARRAAGR